MKKVIKHSTALLLSFLMLTLPSFSIGNYSLTTTTKETYSASSPVGRNTTYTRDAQNLDSPYIQPQSNIVYYPGPEAFNVPYNQAMYETGVTNYNFQTNMMANSNSENYSSTTVNVPQTYNRVTSVTETFRDEREPIDKNIERAGSICAFLSGVAIVGAAIYGVLKD